jgi:glyoxylase-like metal-dependent hydrolase (beta-lactamase superfamily II)
MAVNIVNVGYRSTNYYVLADTRPRLLVDAGWPGTLGAFQHACQRAGIALGDIPYVLATHYHPDHAGLAQELKGFGCRLIVMETQAAAIPLLRTHVKPQDHYVEIDTVGNVLLTFAESRAFLAGIGIAGTIIATPGHSDDSVTLVLDEGAAFTGDLTPLVMASDDPADPVQQRWAKLRAAGATTIYPGHGPVGQLT